MRERVGEVVGREPELAAVDEVLAAGATGPAAAVLFGEAGIGKSTVWEHAVRAAGERGWTVLAARPVESETGLSFGALLDLLDPVADATLGGLPAPQRRALEVALLRRAAPDGAPDHRALCVAVLGTLRLLAARTPVVLAVDDVQWLDEPTADVLGYALRRLSTESVTVLAAVRRAASAASHVSDASDDQPPLPLGLAGRPGVVTLRLAGLSLGALHRLIRTHTGTALPRPALVRVAQVSGGNPFYAVEIARALHRSQPSPGRPLPNPRSLTELVADRISALSPATREVLLHAAALARPTVPQLRAAAYGTGAALDGSGARMRDAAEREDPVRDALAEAEDHGVIELPVGYGVRFTHPLLSAAVYAEATPAQRRAAHRRLAAVVADQESRALHLAHGADGPDQAVAAELEAAAAQARQRGAPGQAAQLWELAVTHAADAEARARCRAAAGDCLFFAGDAAGARSLFEAAVAELPPGPERAAALLGLANVGYFADGPGEALALCRQALAECGGDPVSQARAYLRMSWCCLNDAVARAGHTDRALALLGQAPEPPGDLLACVLVATGYFRFLAGQGLATAEVERGRAMIDPAWTTREAAMARSVLRVQAKYLDPVGARAQWEEFRLASTERGDESAVMQAQVHLAELDCWLGDLSGAARLAAEAAEAAEQIGQRPWLAYSLYVQALAAAQLGAHDDAAEAAERGLALALELDDSWVAVHQLAALGFVELCRQDFAAADRRTGEALATAARAGLGDVGISGVYGDQLEAVVALGDLDRADGLLAELHHRAQVAPRPWIEAVAARSAALVALGRGDLDAAERELAAALAVHDTLPMPFERARTLLALGRLRRRRKEKLAAREALLAARDAFDRLGAVAWAGQASDELGRLGLRRAAGVSAELTPMELRIAELVASGLSNRDVAAAAFVTAKTVEAHLSRIYRKLGVRGRRELTELGLRGSTVGSLPDS
jgi:DNA-binding CsgD family transcriptional regulator/tetratricopeptide (TPR) repeat protein